MIELVCLPSCQLVERAYEPCFVQILLHMAGRDYRLDDFTVFFRRVRTPNNIWEDDQRQSQRGPYFDPYDHYDEPKVMETPSLTAEFAHDDDTPAKRIMDRYRHGSSDSAAQPLVNRV